MKLRDPHLLKIVYQTYGLSHQHRVSQRQLVAHLHHHLIDLRPACLVGLYHYLLCENLACLVDQHLGRVWQFECRHL